MELELVALDWVLRIRNSRSVSEVALWYFVAPSTIMVSVSDGVDVDVNANVNVPPRRRRRKVRNVTYIPPDNPPHSPPPPATFTDTLKLPYRISLLPDTRDLAHRN